MAKFEFKTDLLTGTQVKTITATAPTRIDFAGGTLDVWPVAEVLRTRASVSQQHAQNLDILTLNAAISLCTRCRVSISTENVTNIDPIKGSDSLLSLNKMKLVVADSISKMEFVIPDQTKELFHNFPLVAQVISHFKAELNAQNVRQVSVQTDSDVPRGAGLGGSSSLFVCLVAAFEKLLGSQTFELMRICQLACNLEAGLLGGLAGIQDHLGAAYGGLSSFIFESNGPKRVELSHQAISWLETHCLLALSTGVHHSGNSNWQVLRLFLDGEKNAILAFSDLAQNAHQAAQALVSEDFKSFQKHLTQDWNIRRNAFPVLTNPELDSLYDGFMAAGAQGAKVCGAASGGVMLVTFDGTPSTREKLLHIIQQRNAQNMELKIAREGVRFSEELYS